MKPGDIIHGEKGTYKLFEPLDRRNMYLAHADELYVIKGFARQDIFEQEAEAYGTIQKTHPNVVRPYEIIPNGAYIVLPYLQGETIDERLQRDGPMPLNDALNMFEGICAGLAHIHSYGISHGDVHIGNVMLAPKPVLFDFDLSSDDMIKDISLAATTLYEMLMGICACDSDGFDELACDTHSMNFDSDITHIIENAYGGEYESILDLWSDLEEFIYTG